MARIAGVDLPNKAVKISLTYIYGIGNKSAMDICQKTNIDPEVRINTLSNDEVALLRKVINALNGVDLETVYRMTDKTELKEQMKEITRLLEDVNSAIAGNNN